MSTNIKNLSEFFNAPLEDIAEKFHYSEENLTVLRGDEASFYAKYPKTVAHLKSKDAKWRADNRTPFEFAQSLVVNWLLEDFLALKLSTLGYRTNFNAPDKNRELILNKVTSTPDLKMFIDGMWVPVEVKADYSGGAYKRGTMVLKTGNYTTALKLKSSVLFVDVPNKKFIIVPPTMILGARYIQSFAPFGGKPVYEIDVSSLKFSPLDMTLNTDTAIVKMPTATPSQKIADRLTIQPNRGKSVMIRTDMVKTSLF